jgi:hypothetical protein
LAARIRDVPTLPFAPLVEPVPTPPQGASSHGSRRTRWIWAAGLASAALIIGFFAISVYALWGYANADHLGILDDPVVATAADNACHALQSDVEANTVPKGASVAAIAGSIRAQDVGIERLIATMRSLGNDRLEGDHPAVNWLADWETLARAREAYADTLVAGDKPELALPKVDGIPISQRMSEAAECPAVLELAALP